MLIKYLTDLSDTFSGSGNDLNGYEYESDSDFLISFYRSIGA